MTTIDRLAKHYQQFQLERRMRAEPVSVGQSLVGSWTVDRASHFQSLPVAMDLVCRALASDEAEQVTKFIRALREWIVMVYSEKALHALLADFKEIHMDWESHDDDDVAPDDAKEVYLTVLRKHVTVIAACPEQEFAEVIHWIIRQLLSRLTWWELKYRGDDLVEMLTEEVWREPVDARVIVTGRLSAVRAKLHECCDLNDRLRLSCTALRHLDALPAAVVWRQLFRLVAGVAGLSTASASRVD